METAPKSQKHLYTLLITTPSCASPTFLYKLQQSDIDRKFLGKDALFFRKENPTGWPFSHVVLMSGEDVKLDPTEWQLRQHWSITVESDLEFSSVDDVPAGEYVDAGCPNLKWRKPKEVQGEDRYRYVEPPWKAVRPDDLRQKLSCAFGLLTSKKQGFRCFVLRYIRFVDQDVETRYTNHIAALRDRMADDSDIYVHLDGAISRINKVDYQGKGLVMDTAQHFTFMSFASERDYGEYLCTPEYKNLVDNGLKESMIITKQMWLPPKSEPLNDMNWEYGNPYEPYGEDWFG